MSVFRELMTQALAGGAKHGTFIVDFDRNDEDPLKWSCSLRNMIAERISYGTGPSGEAALRMAVEALHGT